MYKHMLRAVTQEVQHALQRLMFAWHQSNVVLSFAAVVISCNETEKSTS